MNQTIVLDKFGVPDMILQIILKFKIRIWPRYHFDIRLMRVDLDCKKDLIDNANEIKDSHD